MTTQPGPPAMRQPAPPTGVLRALLGLPVHLYHAHLGALLGHRFLLLVHTGRKTGLHRETVLEVVRYDPVTGESVVAAGWGRRTGWLHNVEAGLADEVRTGRQRFAPAYRIRPLDEAERILADYERRNRLIAPIVRAVLSRLLGWRYDGTPTARRRAVEQLTLVAFRPHADGESASPTPGLSDRSIEHDATRRRLRVAAGNGAPLGTVRLAAKGRGPRLVNSTSRAQEVRP